VILLGLLFETGAQTWSDVRKQHRCVEKQSDEEEEEDGICN
jgi:hypothetical protein